MGKTEHHVKNSKEFAAYVKYVNYLKVGPSEELRSSSMDVSALFISVPVDKAKDVIRKKLEEDDSLSKRAPLSPSDIITLLDKCLKCTSSCIRANTTSRSMEQQWAHQSLPSYVTCTGRTSNRLPWQQQKNPFVGGVDSVEDSYMVLRKDQAPKFTDYLTTVDEDIKWTTEV